MGNYRHGIYVTEEGTELLNLTTQASGVTMVVGTAPIRLAAKPAKPNEPVLCATYGDAVSQLGYAGDTDTFTLCEAMEVLYGLYNVAPVVFVNVFNPAVHRETRSRQEHLVTANHTIELMGDILQNTIKLEVNDGEELDTYVEIDAVKIEYSLEKTIVTVANTYAMGAKVYVTYAVPKISAVTSADVIGSVDSDTGLSTGLQTVSEVYARFGLTVGTLIAPGWSHKADVGLALAAKSEDINGHFSAIAVADIDTAQAPGYGLAPTVKNNNGFSHSHLIACYPAVNYGGKVQHLSTHVAGMMAQMSARNGDIPYKSPSNQAMYASGMCNFDGSSNYFGLEAANLLNGQGIVTMANFNGWRIWGNEMSAYPSTSDPKDRWINVRRMFDFIKARLVLGFWSQIDVPIARRTIDSVVNSVNTYLNGLVNIGALLGGRVEFNESENTETGIMEGQINFHCYITPPSPAKEINFVLQYDANYLSNVLKG